MRRYGTRKALRRVAMIAAVGVGSLFLYGSAFAAWGQPSGITDQAREMHNLYLFVLVMAALVFIAVEGALIYAIIRFRRRKADEMPVQTHGSNVVEFIWTGIPVAIVLALFTYSFIVLERVQEKAEPGDMSIEVLGFQFSWQFTYSLNNLGPGSDPNAEGEIVVLATPPNEPELVIPVDERVEFRLVSNDVIHSFYVRDFLYKLDVVPGRDNRFAITARETGTYMGACAELCGTDHALMRFSVRVVERDEFDAWVAEMTDDAAVRGR
jgi:cytochrome c oxidase subunit II